MCIISGNHLIVPVDKEPYLQRIEASESCPLGEKMVLEFLQKESWLFIAKKGLKCRIKLPEKLSLLQHYFV